MPEPQVQPGDVQEPSSFRKKVYNTLSRKFSKSKLEKELMNDENEVADIDAADDDDDEVSNIITCTLCSIDPL